MRVGDHEAGGSAWEEFDVTSAVKRHVIQMGGGGKAVGLLRLRVKVDGAADRSRRRLTFGDDWCDDVNVRELRHRHHPVLNVLTRDRSVYCSLMFNVNVNVIVFFAIARLQIGSSKALSSATRCPLIETGAFSLKTMKGYRWNDRSRHNGLSA